jgi:NTP pyrophosphatase (non-canonical NTP hydrolase)
MKYIVAGSPQQFKWWTAINGLGYLDVVQIKDADTLRGLDLDPGDVVLVGEWWKHPHIEAIMAIMNAVWRVLAKNNQRPEQPTGSFMNITEFAWRNRQRCEAPDGFNHQISSWSLSDWMTATAGELGEAANVIKKLNRIRDGVVANQASESELRQQLADELADTFCYLDLLAQAAGVNLEEAVRKKWNQVSERQNYPGRI